MNRYLTELAKKNPKWHIPAAALSVLLGIVGVSTWIDDSPAGENFFIWLLAHLLVMAFVLWPLVYIVRWRVRQYDAGRIARKLANREETSIPLVELDRIVGRKNADLKIEDLLKRGFLQRMELDGGWLLLDQPAPAAAPEPAAEPAPEGVVGEIRRLNDEIDDPAVSERIDRIERVTASILRTLEEKPDRADAARRFMNYYLPTTLKLLESYRLMEKQSYQGENIQASRRRIEDVLDKIVAATERQQDRLFGTEALDVEAEISVLETMMTSDGLLESRGMARGGT